MNTEKPLPEILPEPLPEGCNIPQNHLEFARQLARLARMYNLAELKADWLPGPKDPWKARVALKWGSLEESAILSSTHETRTRI